MAYLNEETLYLGFDESNHAGRNRKGEIVAGVVSCSKNDSVVRVFPNTRNYSEFNKWINKNPFNDFRFTILTGDKYRYRSSSSNLSEVVPFLARSFISPATKCLKIYLDGRLSKEEREFIRNSLFMHKGIEKITIENFIKKSRKNRESNFRKGPVCPAVVYWADVISNKLLSEEVQTLLSHPKFIPYP